MPVAVVWLKRDLRLRDHEPLLKAAQSGFRVLMLYCFEPFQLEDEHYRWRHWLFVLQSLQDMAAQLPEYALVVSEQDAVSTLNHLHQAVPISAIFSHQEVGLANTYQRDKDMATWCQRHQVNWHQSPYASVIRGLSQRDNWQKNWHAVMRSECKNCVLNQVNWLCLPATTWQSLGLTRPRQVNIGELQKHVAKAHDKQVRFDEQTGEFQQGGERHAHQALASFFNERGKPYYYSLSSPTRSQTHCSRLSAYLAWGNLSLRQVYQATLTHWQQQGWRRSLVAFSSRLHWHCHFIQKFESQSEIEFEPMNEGYQTMPYIEGELADQRLLAWQQGQTGIPMVDACMRCLLATGYLNFRMRAMLVSFLCHHLDVNWQRGVKHLASVFLDFEPGIHYSQFHMQAGITGINTIRIYNPIKQGADQDSEGEFVRRWCPELAQLPNELIHTPWQMTQMERLFYQVDLGADYPFPIVDIKQSYQAAQTKLWHWRNMPIVKQQVAGILRRHVQPKSMSSKRKPKAVKQHHSGGRQ
ncbi:DNA photolyase family protein [Motilimonas eburnea]|nr:DNA photolyase family protein [Motilimonas eburnea]